jgi:hypothetical protein
MVTTAGAGNRSVLLQNVPLPAGKVDASSSGNEMVNIINTVLFAIIHYCKARLQSVTPRSHKLLTIKYLCNYYLTTLKQGFRKVMPPSSIYRPSVYPVHDFPNYFQFDE